jgi:hypothetical protein
MKTNKKEEGVRRQKENSNFDERGLVWEPKVQTFRFEAWSK